MFANVIHVTTANSIRVKVQCSGVDKVDEFCFCLSLICEGFGECCGGALKSENAYREI